jgi:hypothetical protein
MLPSGFTPFRRARFAYFHLLWLGLFAAVISRAAEDGVKKTFHLAGGIAEVSLKAFAEQSGCGVIFASEAVKDVRTNLVKGDFTSREALTLLLRDTGLVGSVDAKTGAYAVRRLTPEETKNGYRAAQKETRDRPMNLQSLKPRETPILP